MARLICAVVSVTKTRKMTTKYQSKLIDKIITGPKTFPISTLSRNNSHTDE